MYIPDAGDIAWIDFSPQSGSETAQRHAGVVLTPPAYSIATGLALVVPMTTKAKGGSFEVPMRGARRAKGVVLANERRTIDYATRRAQRFDACPPEILQQVRDVGESASEG